VETSLKVHCHQFHSFSSVVHSSASFAKQLVRISIEEDSAAVAPGDAARFPAEVLTTVLYSEEPEACCCGAVVVETPVAGFLEPGGVECDSL